MADKVITYKVKVVNENGQVVETLASDFTTLKKSVGDLEKELENTDFGSQQFKELSKELKNSKGALEEAQSATMSLGDKFASIPGPVGQVAQSVMGLQKAFLVLVANPIGATIAALAVVLKTAYEAITATEEGTFKLKQLMGALSGVLDPVIKLFSEIGVILIDNVLAGLDAVRKGLEFLGFDQFAKASEDGQKLAKTLTDIEEKEGDLNVERAKQNKLLAEAREILSDSNKSLAERQKALNQVKQSEEDLSKKEVSLAQQRLKAIRDEMKMRGESAKLLDMEEKALIELYNTEQSQAAVRRKNTKLQQALDKEAGAARKEAAKEAEEERKTQLKNEEEYQKMKRLLELGTIEEARQRDLQKTQQEKEEQDKRIKQLEISEAQKAELLALNEEQLRVKLAEVNAKYDKEEQDKKDATAKAEYDKQVALVDSLLELDRLKYENMSTLTEEDLNQTIKLMTEKAQLLLQQEGLTAEKRLMIEKQLQLGIRKLTEDTARAQWEAEKLKFQAIANAFGQVAEIAGEQSGIAKVAAVAQATINTYLSATEAYKAVSGIPIVGPALAPIAAAAAVAAGLKTVQKITGIFTDVPEANIPKFAQGGIVMGQGSPTSDNISAMLSPGESILTARATQMFSPILSLMNQMGGGARFSGGITSNGVDMGQMEMLNAMKKQQNTPVKAYVTSSQMTNQMMLDRASKSRSLI
jgi:hypothetical protein